MRVLGARFETFFPPYLQRDKYDDEGERALVTAMLEKARPQHSPPQRQKPSPCAPGHSSIPPSAACVLTVR